jgi:hypothetical protein
MVAHRAVAVRCCVGCNVGYRDCIVRVYRTTDPVRVFAHSQDDSLSGRRHAGPALTVAVLLFSQGSLEADASVLAMASAEPVALLAPLESVAAVALPGSVASTTLEVGVADSDVQVSPDAPDMTDDDATAVEVAHALEAESFALGTPLSRPVRFMTGGDSTAFYVGQAFAVWALDHPQYATSDLLWRQGCGLLRAGAVTIWDDTTFSARSREMLTSQHWLPGCSLTWLWLWLRLRLRLR